MIVVFIQEICIPAWWSYSCESELCRQLRWLGCICRRCYDYNGMEGDRSNLVFGICWFSNIFLGSHGEKRTLSPWISVAAFAYGDMKDLLAQAINFSSNIDFTTSPVSGTVRRVISDMTHHLSPQPANEQRVWNDNSLFGLYAQHVWVNEWATSCPVGPGYYTCW